jgi:hypothetical protein
MKAPVTIGSITLRFIALKDWTELTGTWLAARQQEHEAALRRSGASAQDIALAAQDYASKRSAYATLIDMCKTYDGAQAILERSAARSGVPAQALDAALEGMDPDSVCILAMRVCGWDIKPPQDAQQGNQ